MKYFGTMGPACAEKKILSEMIEGGMTGIRLNLSHSGLIDCEKWMELIRLAQKEAGKTIELLIDLEGPELRIGILPQPILLQEGEEVSLGLPGEGKKIPIPRIGMESILSGRQLLLDDGKILIEVGKDKKSAVVLRGGRLAGRKSIAFLDHELNLPALTESDVTNLALAKEYGIRGVMLPFVRRKEDLVELHKVLKDMNAEDIEVYAKIESQAGVRALEELLPYCDEIVIARGDLGNSCPLWELPLVQEHIAQVCESNQKRFMVVTQMLASMEQSKLPTRAEVSDIFLAVRQGASSLMLTGETAIGNYPGEAMEYLIRTGAATAGKK